MAQAAGSGGAVFNSAPGTPRLVPDPATDYLLPPAGALNYSIITQLNALLSTNGTATSLVHGDHNEMMIGNEIRTVTLDRDHTILGNQFSTVMQDRHDTIQQNLNQQVIGATQEVYVGAAAEHHVAENCIVHEADRHLNEPQKIWHFISERVEAGDEVRKSYGLKVEVASSKIDATVIAAVEITGAAVEFAVTKVEGTGTTGYEFGMLKAKAHTAEAKVDLISSKLEETSYRLALAEFAIQELFETPLGVGVYL